MVKSIILKSQFQPVERITDNLYHLMFMLGDMTVNDEVTDYCEIIECYHKGSLSEDVARKLVENYFNPIIDQEIIEGFEWDGMAIWLSSENQFNYKAAYDLAVQTNGQNLPVTFKFGKETPQYYVFESISDLQSFYMSAMAYINGVLEEGWRKKDNFDWSLYNDTE